MSRRFGKFVAVAWLLLAAVSLFGQNGKVYGSARTPFYEPVPDVTITLRDASGAVVRSTTTDGNGVFNFADVPPGTYTVVATNGVTELRKSGAFTVRAGESAYQPLNLDKKPEIKKPEPQPTVTPSAPPSSPPEKVVPAEPKPTPAPPATEPKPAPPVETTTPKPAPPQPKPETPKPAPTGVARVLGTIRNLDAEPLAGYDVFLLGLNGQGALGPINTGIDGMFSFGVVPAGDFAIVVKKDGVELQRETITADNGATVAKNVDVDTRPRLALNAPVEISGNVKRADGTAGSSLRVEVRSAYLQDKIAGMVMTDADGRFVFKSITPGRYFLRVFQGETALKDSTPFSLAPARPYSTVVTLDPQR